MIPIAAIPISISEVFSLAWSQTFGKIVGQPAVTKFENELAHYAGSKRAIACNTGRTALYMAVKSLALKPGDEVIVPAYTCAIVFEMVLRAGLRPVFVDVNLDTCNLDPELVQKAVTSRTKLILPVHLFGRPCDMDPILEVADKYGLYIVEDVAQALGAEYKGQKAGSFGDLAVFSFGPGKSITGGEGGAVAVNNTELTETVCRFQSSLTDPDLAWKLHVTRNVLGMRIFSNPSLYGLVKSSVDSSMEKTDENIIQNCLAFLKDPVSTLRPSVKPAKMPEPSASVVLKQLQKIDDLNNKRIANAQKLSALLSNQNEKSILLPKMVPDTKNTLTRFPVRILKGSRTSLIKEMLKRGVDTRELYYYAADLLHKLSDSRFPNAEALSDSLMALPNHPLLTDSDIEEISSSLILSLQVS